MAQFKHKVPEGYVEKQMPGVLGSMQTVYTDPKTGDTIFPEYELQQAMMDRREDANKMFNNILFPTGAGAFYGLSNIAAGNLAEGALELVGTLPIPFLKSAKGTNSKQLPGSPNAITKTEKEKIRETLRKNVTFPKDTGQFTETPPWPNRFLELDDNAWVIGNMETGRTSIPKQDVDFLGRFLNPVPRRLPGASTTFKSEIDWRNWVKNKEDFDNNPDVINELFNIERKTKADGTWMTNPDGSPFQGTPEQFVIQQSSNFKKAFGNSKLVNPDGSPIILYHGSAKKFDTFDPDMFQLGDAGYSGAGIYTTPSKVTANSYASSSAKFHRGDIEPTVYELYGQGNNPIKSSELIQENAGRDLFNFHRDRNFKGELSPYESLRNYDAAISDQLQNVEYIRPLHDAREIVFPRNNQVKSAVGNILFDMNNPNIYKALVPAAIGTGAAAVIAGQDTPQQKYGGWLNKYQDGGSSDYDKIPQSWKDTYDWTPNVEAEYQAFKNDPAAPSNLAGTDDMNDYNTRGMWDSLDRPADWNQALALYKDMYGEEWMPEEDGYYHGWSQNPRTGEWLKPKHHDTSWMNYMTYVFDPNAGAVVNPEGFFGEETLQSYPKKTKYPDGGGVFNKSINKKGNLKTSAEGYYAYINGVNLSNGGSPKSGWLNKYNKK
jgi:hypothetical protein